MLLVAMSEMMLGYIDPGSGSIIFQAAIAAAMAVGLGARVFWSRITGLFRRSDAQESEELTGRNDPR